MPSHLSFFENYPYDSYYEEKPIKKRLINLQVSKLLSILLVNFALVFSRRRVPILLNILFFLD